MEAEVAADEPAARAVRQARSQQELRRVQRPGGDDDRARVDAAAARRRVDVLDARRPRRPRSRRARRARRRAARAGRPPRRRGCTCSASTCRRSSGSPAGRSRSSCSSRRCRTCTGSSCAPSARNAGLDRAHALPPVAALANAEPLLDPVVVRVEVGRAERRAPASRRSRSPRATWRSPSSCARSATFVLIVVVPPTQRPPSSGDRAAGAAVDQREADRPPEVVRRLRLPAREVGRRQVRAAPRAAARGGRGPRARRPRPRRPRRSRPRRRRSARSSDPQVRPVLRQPRGERGVEVDLRPRAGRIRRSGATKSL